MRRQCSGIKTLAMTHRASQGPKHACKLDLRSLDGLQDRAHDREGFADWSVSLLARADLPHCELMIQPVQSVSARCRCMTTSSVHTYVYAATRPIPIPARQGLHPYVGKLCAFFASRKCWNGVNAAAVMTHQSSHELQLLG